MAKIFPMSGGCTPSPPFVAPPGPRTRAAAPPPPTSLSSTGRRSALALAGLAAIVGALGWLAAAAGPIAPGAGAAALQAGAIGAACALLFAVLCQRCRLRRRAAAAEATAGRLLDAVETLREGVVVANGCGRIVFANRRAAALLPEAAPFAPGAPAPALGGLSLADGEEGELCTAEGRWLRVGRSSTREGGFVLVLADITAFKRQQAALEQANFRLEAALNNMSQGLCLYDADQRLLVANRRFYEIFRLDPAVVHPGIAFRDLLRHSVAAGNHAPEAAEALIAERLAFVARGEAGTTFQNLADGRVIAISHEPIPGGHWVVTYDDITERRRAEAQIAWLARHDGLTGLPNRLVLRERLDEACARLAQGQRFALLVLDLDGFSAANETLGQAGGDAVLREVAERLRGAVREGDMVARLGGDEFAVLQGGIASAEDAAALARRLAGTIATPFRVDGRTVHLTASVGIALGPEDGTAPDLLVYHAQLALGLCRARRGAFCFFKPEMDAALQRRRTLENDLRGALERDEFEPVYQPVVEIATGRVVGVEALLRWRHPSRGTVSPLEFIPVAEELGLIVPIGSWMLRRACADAAAWPEGVRVAVNVSASQLRDPDLVGTVASTLAESGLAASRLEIEITESLLIEDAETTAATLHRLRGLGVRIAMDDFGTGYSSLGYLRRFPFDKIKIDQSFIRDLDDRPDSRAIVRAIIGLGRSLGMRTTAEGVESRAVLDILRAEGCTEAQGYLFGEPCAASRVPAVLRLIAQRRAPANVAVA